MFLRLSSITLPVSLPSPATWDPDARRASAMARGRSRAPIDPCPDHLGTLSPEHWQGLRQQQARLDHRASSTTALLAYAAAGVLPSAQPLLRSRSDQARLRPSRPLPPANAKLTCAVCRIATHELALAAAVARRTQARRWT